MSKQEVLVQTLKDNWYLVIAVLLCVGAIGYRLMMPGEAPAPETATRTPVDRLAPLVDPRTDTAAAPVARDADVHAMIEDYQQRVATDPEHPDSAATLMAIGNLYRDRLQDCDQAAAFYEQAINDYPEAVVRRDIYIQLADCYDRVGRFDMRDAVYRDMLAYFPDDSEEYLWARQQLSE